VKGGLPMIKTAETKAGNVHGGVTRSRSRERKSTTEDGFLSSSNPPNSALRLSMRTR